MSKERARRRAERLAVAERERAVRARRQRRRALLRSLVPRLPVRRRRTGRLFARRTPAQRAVVAVATLVAAGAIWLFIDDLALRLALIVLLFLALPAIVVIATGRRT